MSKTNWARHWAQRFTILLVASLLQGCLIVELLGPVAGATVSIRPLLRAVPVVSDLVTADAGLVRDQLGISGWGDLDPGQRLSLLGGVSLPRDQFDPDEWYLVTATGGEDTDLDENAELDSEGFPNAGTLHAIVKGADLRSGQVRVNVLTEALYQYLRPQLRELSDSELQERLDRMATRVVEDVNEDSAVNYRDVLSWSFSQTREQYGGSLARFYRLWATLILGVDAEFIAAESFALVDSGAWRPAQPAGEFATYITECLAPVFIDDICPFGALPPLGMTTDKPTINDIMARVVISDEWMRQRFRAVLRRMPDEMLLLFRSITAIVIDRDIRPSYFLPGTSAIYLDAANFWLEPQERAQISTQQDFRAAFDDELNFADRWRYTRDGEWRATGSTPAGESRELDDIIERIAALLFHELGHAADWLPVETHPYLRPDETPLDLNYELISDRLAERTPLHADELTDVAAVMFLGVRASETIRSYTGGEIGHLFKPDGANDLYNYTNQFEDLAMLFEEFMMQRHFGLQREIAFTDAPIDAENRDDVDCDEYIIRWGVRGRIGEQLPSERLGFVLPDILPELEDHRAAIAELPRPQRLPLNRGWCEVLNDGDLAESAAQLQQKFNAQRQIYR